MKVYPVELLERCLKLTVSLFKTQCESEMCTASRRERRFVQNQQAAQARARWHVCPARAAHQKHSFFIGKRENAHRMQARAHCSKCAPRAGESSILPTQDGAHDHVSKQNEHCAEAGAPFSIKKCTAHTREAQQVKTEPRKCCRCSGAHPTNFVLDQPDVCTAQQGAAK